MTYETASAVHTRWETRHTGGRTSSAFIRGGAWAGGIQALAYGLVATIKGRDGRRYQRPFSDDSTARAWVEQNTEA